MRTKYSNIPFLTEVLINILFFSISASILVQLFSKAVLYSENTLQESLAISLMYSVSETIKVEGAENYPDIIKENDTEYWVFYDENWRVTQENPRYYLKIMLTPLVRKSGILTELYLAIYNAHTGEEEYRLYTAYYQVNERSI